MNSLKPRRPDLISTWPRLEDRREARLWNEVFTLAQDALSVPRGTIRATVLIETLPAAFEMEEILYELRRHSAGLNAGRWDYTFSIIKKFRQRPDSLLPDRGASHHDGALHASLHRVVGPDLPSARRACHWGAWPPTFPAGGIPKSTNGPWRAFARTNNANSADGFDGTWVAHPDLVPVAGAVFDGVLGDRPHQKDRLREEAARYREPTGRPSAFRAARSPKPVSGRTSMSPCSIWIPGWVAMGPRQFTT